MKLTEKEKKNSEIFLTVWFISFLILPVLLPIIFSNKELLEVILDWIVHVGESLLFAFIIKILISYFKKTRPRFSIDIIFLTIATIIYLFHITIISDVFESNESVKDKNTSTIKFKESRTNRSFTNSLEPDKLEELMITVRDKVNQYCPQNVGQGLMLRNVAVLPDHIFSYNYFFINYTFQDLREIGFEFTDEDKRQLINSIRSNPDIGILRDNGVTFWYRFHDNELNFFDKIVITKEDYSKPIPENIPSKYIGYPKGIRYDDAIPIAEFQHLGEVAPVRTLIDNSKNNTPIYMILYPCTSTGLEEAVNKLIFILEANQSSFDSPDIINDKLPPNMSLQKNFIQFSNSIQNGEAFVGRIWKLGNNWGIIWIANGEECSISILQSQP